VVDSSCLHPGDATAAESEAVASATVSRAWAGSS
jgi:hypothetical protein